MNQNNGARRGQRPSLWQPRLRLRSATLMSAPKQCFESSVEKTGVTNAQETASVTPTDVSNLLTLPDERCNREHVDYWFVVDGNKKAARHSLKTTYGSSSPTRSQSESRFCRARCIRTQQVTSSTDHHVPRLECPSAQSCEPKRHEKAGSRSSPACPLLSVAARLRQVRKPSGTCPISGGQPGTGDAGASAAQPWLFRSGNESDRRS